MDGPRLKLDLRASFPCDRGVKKGRYLTTRFYFNIFIRRPNSITILGCVLDVATGPRVLILSLKFKRGPMDSMVYIFPCSKALMFCATLQKKKREEDYILAPNLWY